MLALPLTTGGYKTLQHVLLPAGQKALPAYSAAMVEDVKWASAAIERRRSALFAALNGIQIEMVNVAAIQPSDLASGRGFIKPRSVLI